MPRATCNGVEIEYEVRGEGAPLLMVMGIGSQLSDWSDGFLDTLCAAGFQLITFDNRDMGLSGRIKSGPVPPVSSLIARSMLSLDVDVPYGLEDMADDAAALLEHLGIERAHVLGTSLGGMIAQTIALRHPRQTLSLMSVMSMAGRRRHALGTPSALKALLSPPARTAEEAEEQSLNFLRVCGSRAWPRDEAAVRRLARRSFERCNDKSGFPRQFAAVVKSGSRYQALRAVTAPTTVIHGSIDPLVRPAGGKDTARAIPGAKLRMVEGMGHDLPSQVWPLIADEMRELADRA